MAQSIKKNTILSIIKTCSTILYPLITFPYVNRVLFPVNVGKVNFAQNHVNYFLLIAMLGVTTYAIRECSIVRDDKEKLSDTASQIMSINICFTFLAYFLLLLSVLCFRKIDSYRLLILIESFTIIFTVLGADWLNSAMEDYKYITLRTIIAQFLSIIAMFVFVKNENDYVKYAIICVGSASLANISNILYRRKYCNTRFTLKIDWKRHFPPILLLFGMMLAQTILSCTDVTMLGLMKNDYEVGLYSTAHKVTKLIGSVVQALALVIIPRLYFYFESNDFNSANVLLRKVLMFNISLGLPCFVGVEMMAEDIVFVVGGEEFAAATPVIRLLIISFLFSLVGGSFLGNAVLIPMKKEKYYMIVCIITAVCNIAVNALLIPRYGAVGAAIATALNGFIIFVLLLLKVDKRIKIKDVKGVFLGPVIGCIGIALACFICSRIEYRVVRIITSVSLSIIVYALVLFVLKNEFLSEILKVVQAKTKRKGKSND